MQPTLVFTAAEPGMILLNGRFAGESGPDRGLMVPVAPFGAVYAQYIPLTGAQRPAAFKCVLSGGSLMPGSPSGSEGVTALQWPGGILELEIDLPEKRTEHFTAGSVSGVLSHGSETALSFRETRISLPRGSEAPRLVRLGSIPALTGIAGEAGRYLITLSEDLSRHTGLLVADRLDLSGGDVFTAFTDLRDIVGHGRLEQWQAGPEGLSGLSAEPVWANGGPSWPQTARDTMIAAAQAAMEDLTGEADRYFIPALGDTSPLSDIAEKWDLCLPMKYGLPDERACVGLVRLENEHVASVTPLYFRARMTGGPQGPWQIDWVGL